MQGYWESKKKKEEEEEVGTVSWAEKKYIKVLDLLMGWMKAKTTFTQRMTDS